MPEVVNLELSSTHWFTAIINFSNVCFNLDLVTSETNTMHDKHALFANPVHTIASQGSPTFSYRYPRDWYILFAESHAMFRI